MGSNEVSKISLGSLVKLRAPKTIVVYCDESCFNCHRYLVIGGIYFGLKVDTNPEPLLAQIEEHLQGLKEQHRLGRVKWEKVPSEGGRYFDGYTAFVDEFLDNTPLSFKCLVVDTHVNPIDNGLWDGDPLVGFLKFYCVFLSDGLMRWSPEYFHHIRIDQYEFRNGNGCRELERSVTGRFVKKARPHPYMEHCSIEALDHRTSNLLQLTDLLVGAVAFAWNSGSERTSKRAFAKQRLLEHIQAKTGCNLCTPVGPFAPGRMNVWKLVPADTASSL